jgi:hypothetical protein
VRITNQHLRDVPVAVQVLRRIFVQQAVAVVVERPNGAARAAVRVGDVVVRLVRVELGHDVEGARVERLRDERVGPVAGQQRVDRVQADLAAEDLARMQVAVDPVRGLVGGPAGRVVGNLQHQQVLARVTLADAVQLRQLRAPRDDGVEVRSDLRVGVRVIEQDRRRSGRLRERLGDGHDDRCEQGHRHDLSSCLPRHLCPPSCCADYDTAVVSLVTAKNVTLRHGARAGPRSVLNEGRTFKPKQPRV